MCETCAVELPPCRRAPPSGGRAGRNEHGSPRVYRVTFGKPSETVGRKAMELRCATYYVCQAADYKRQTVRKGGTQSQGAVGTMSPCRPSY